MRATNFAQIVKERLSQTRQSLHGAAVSHGLPRDAVRSVLDGHMPRLDRAMDIAAALGLEFYIGPPRSEDAADIAEPSEATQTAILASSAEATPQNTIAAVSEAMSQQLATILRSEAETIRQQVCEGISRHLHALQGQAIPPGTPPANDLEDPGALGVQATADSATGAPGVRSVQMIEMEAAAGGGAYNLDDAPARGPVWFRRDWIDSRGIDPTQAVVISVHGDSMEPTLPAGCKILVNRQRRRRRVGNIYVITTPDGLIVKRLGRGEGGRWLLVSDNDSPDWPDMPWPDDAVVAGEVKWMARELP